jgi:hypothetical protein
MAIVENVGNSPALDIQFRIIVGEVNPATALSNKSSAAEVPNCESLKPVTTLASHESVEIACSLRIEDVGAVCIPVMVTVSYRDSYNAGYTETLATSLLDSDPQ